MIISLSPGMRFRLSFSHDLFDLQKEHIKTRDFDDEAAKYLKGGDRDDFLMRSIWLVKDVVSRFRAHFPETVKFTDDMVSEGVFALTEFITKLADATSFYNRATARIHDRLRDWINNNRSICSASRSTNYRLQKEERPLEYHFVESIPIETLGEEHYSLEFVDILDSIEALRATDKEEMVALIQMFLDQEHGIDEESLTDEELRLITKLAGVGINL